MQENVALPAQQLFCTQQHYNLSPWFFQGGIVALCVALDGGVGIVCHPCAAFVLVSTCLTLGDGQDHPPGLETSGQSRRIAAYFLVSKTGRRAPVFSVYDRKETSQ